MQPRQRSPFGRALDLLYAASGALAACCLAGIAVMMLAQAGMRELGLLLRGADDIVAWLCAGSAFLALGYTFRHGELVRVGLVLEHVGARTRQRMEIVSLGAALVVVGYITFAVVRFVHQSWKFGEIAQGLLEVPIWIPQMTLVIGAIVLLVAVLDEFVALLRGATPAYLRAEEQRRVQKELTENL